MKREIIFLFLCILFLIGADITSAELDGITTCKDLNDALCIEVWFNTSTGNFTDKPSEYGKFPYYTRQGDHLYIGKFIVTNKGRQTKNFVYTLSIFPLDYDKLDERITKKGPYNPTYSTIKIDIPSLVYGSKFELYYLGDNQYLKKLNGTTKGNYSLWKIELYKEGEWFIGEDTGVETSHTPIFNGKEHSYKIFQVNPPMELETFSDVRKQVQYIIPTFIIVSLSLTVASLSLIIFICSLINSKKRNKEIMIILRSLRLSVETIKNKIIQNKRDEEIVTILRSLRLSVGRIKNKIIQNKKRK